MMAWALGVAMWVGSAGAILAFVSGTRGRRRRAAAVACFLAGVVTLIAALSPWVENPAERLLWAHMTQHLLLILVAAPLLVLARPGPAFRAAMPPRHRRRVARIFYEIGSRAPNAAAIALIACTAAVVALLGWHVPALFDGAVHSEAIHALEHVTLFGTAAWFWWTVLDGRARARAGAGLAMASLTVVTFAGAALGALMVFSARPWYEVYVAAEGRATALHDQQLAGVLMWIPPSVIFLAVTAYVFVAWLDRAATELDAATRQVRT